MDTFKKKKVLFVIDSLNSGGAEKSLVTVLTLLNENKYDIHLLTFSSGGLYTDLVPTYVKRIETPDYNKYLQRELKELDFTRKLKFTISRTLTSIFLRIANIIKKIKPKFKLHPAQVYWYFCKSNFKILKNEYDVAVAYSQGVPTYYVANKIKAVKKLCWVNIDYDFAGYSPKFDAQYYNVYNNIINVSDKCQEVYIKSQPKYSKRTIVVYDILAEELIRKMATENLNFDNDFKGLKILTIGRLAIQKGYEIAIEAAHSLKKSNIHFKWYVIGEGPLKEELTGEIKKKELEENFIFLGTYTNPYPYIRQCDIYCQPSRFEGYGLAIAEARILSKPIVATNFEIVYNQINHEENGIITEMNGHSVSKGIQKIINDESLKSKLIANLEKEKVGNESEIKKVEKLFDN